MIRTVDMDAALEETAYWESEMLSTMARNDEGEDSSEYPALLEKPTETLGPGTFGATQSSAVTLRGWERPVVEPVEPKEDKGPRMPEEKQAGPGALGTLGPEPLSTARPSPVLGAANLGTQASSYSMQIVASEGHATQKDVGERSLETRNGQNGPVMEGSLITSHESQPGRGKDPGAFTVTCGIGEAQIHHCLIDLGAAVNAMPYSLYCSLGIGPLKPPKLMIELGDKSCIRPVGLLEDLILRVGELVVPADFYVLEMGEARKDDPPTLILGRPFLYATKARIDMGEGLLSLAFGGRISDFYIYDDDGRPGTRKPPDIVNTSELSALVSILPRETESATKPAVMVKISSPTRKGMRASPPEQWRPDPSSSVHGGLGRIKEGAAAKFDLTLPWDPNQ